MLVGLNKDPSDVTCAVAMSGGIDSSVVAALLHEAGYKVIGITLQLYDDGQLKEKKGACCAGQDIYDARLVADHLGINHYVLNYENRFKEAVIDDFIDTYLSGQTPIPCVRCNQSVKFLDLLNFAKKLNVDCLATGHYVKKIIGKNGLELHKGVDNFKDQSYFLFATTQEQLSFLQFPLGDMNKSSTKEHAKRLGLSVAEKPESQDICFVSGSYADVIKKLRPNSMQKGKIMHVDGYPMGEHDGIVHYTIGQRKGINISFSYPLYVAKIDAEKNIIYVGPKESLYSKRFKIKDINLLCSYSEIANLNNLEVKVRYKHEGGPASIEMFEGDYYIDLFSEERAIAKGQACVLYDGSRVLGGGWIA
jgi:tRNA-specific 2-thiouridylase